MQAAKTQGKHGRQTNDSLKCLPKHTHEDKLLPRPTIQRVEGASTLGACLMAFVANQWIIYVPRFCHWPTHTTTRSKRFSSDYKCKCAIYVFGCSLRGFLYFAYRIIPRLGTTLHILYIFWNFYRPRLLRNPIILLTFIRSHLIFIGVLIKFLQNWYMIFGFILEKSCSKWVFLNILRQILIFWILELCLYVLYLTLTLSPTNKVFL